MENKNEYNVEEIFSKVLRAGRRTYFFDVRETKAGDYYLTITESKKFTNEDGTFYYKKHKIINSIIYIVLYYAFLCVKLILILFKKLINVSSF